MRLLQDLVVETSESGLVHIWDPELPLRRVLLLTATGYTTTIWRSPKTDVCVMMRLSWG